VEGKGLYCTASNLKRRKKRGRVKGGDTKQRVGSIPVKKRDLKKATLEATVAALLVGGRIILKIVDMRKYSRECWSFGNILP